MKDLTKSYPGLEHIEVLSIKHWTKKTFSFKCVRPKNLRFRSGEFVMIGLENGEKPLLRAYSIASPSWDEILEFYSIKVEDGPLTSRLQHLVEGENIFLAISFIWIFMKSARPATVPTPPNAKRYGDSIPAQPDGCDR